MQWTLWSLIFCSLFSWSRGLADDDKHIYTGFPKRGSIVLEASHFCRSMFAEAGLSAMTGVTYKLQLSAGDGTLYRNWDMKELGTLQASASLGQLTPLLKHPSDEVVNAPMNLVNHYASITKASGKRGLSYPGLRVQLSYSTSMQATSVVLEELFLYSPEVYYRRDPERRHDIHKLVSRELKESNCPACLNIATLFENPNQTFFYNSKKGHLTPSSHRRRKGCGSQDGGMNIYMRYHVDEPVDTDTDDQALTPSAQ